MLRHFSVSRVAVILVLAVVIFTSFLVLPWFYFPTQAGSVTGIALLLEALTAVLRGEVDISTLVSTPVVSFIALVPLSGLLCGLAVLRHEQAVRSLPAHGSPMHGVEKVHLDEQLARRSTINAGMLLLYFVVFAIQNGQSRENLADFVGIGFWVIALIVLVLLVLSWEVLLKLTSSAIDFFFRPAQRVLGTERMGYLFVLPNLLIFGIFILIPMLLNFYFALTSGQSILPENREFVGSENLGTLLTCEDYFAPLTCEEDRFWRAAGNTFVYVSGELLATVVIALITALALNRQIVGRAFFRSVFFYPVLLSPVVVALIWKWVLQTDYGALNALIVNLGGEKVRFLTDGGWASFWTILVNVWAQMGFYTLILLAGLQSIPSELYEAGSIDGANALSKFQYVTLPLLRPTLLVVIVLAVIRAVQVFDHVFVLTGGGPGTATLYLVQYIFQTGFDQRRFGMAAAASLVLASVLLVVTFVQLRIGRRGEAV